MVLFALQADGNPHHRFNLMFDAAVHPDLNRIEDTAYFSWYTIICLWPAIVYTGRQEVRLAQYTGIEAVYDYPCVDHEYSFAAVT